MTDDQAPIADGLSRLVRSRLGARSVAYVREPTRLSGGFSAETFAFELLDPPPELSGPLVLRLMRRGDDAKREIALHRAVVSLGFPAPKIRMADDTSAEFDGPFLIADYVDGRDALKGWGVRRAFREVPVVLAGLMTQLHRLEADRVTQELDEVGWPAARLGVDGLLSEIAVAIDDVKDAALRSGLEWLRAEKPDVVGRSIVHGDLHGLNLLVADGRVKAVLDWELARVTHPEFDVARTKVILDTVPGMSSALLRPLVQAFGRRSAAALLQSYESQSPLDRDRLRWWEAAHCLRLVAIVRQHRATDHPHASDNVIGAWAPLEGRLAHRFAELTGGEV